MPVEAGGRGLSGMRDQERYYLLKVWLQSLTVPILGTSRLTPRPASFPDKQQLSPGPRQPSPSCQLWGKQGSAP